MCRFDWRLDKITLRLHVRYDIFCLDQSGFPKTELVHQIPNKWIHKISGGNGPVLLRF